MKRGIRHMTLANPPVGTPEIEPLDFARAQILGIPIEYHPHSKFPTADARGFFWNRHIAVGPQWTQLDARTQRATLFHEARHLLRWHREQRALLCALLALPALVFLSWRELAAIALTIGLFFIVEALSQRHEFDADAFAAEYGYGKELLGLVKRAGPPPMLPTFYPDYEKRCAALERRIKERDDAGT